MATAQFLWSYCHSTHGVYHPPTPADKAFAHLTVLAAAETGAAGSKAEQAKANAAGAAGAAAHLAALQQRLPQLVAALKAALAAASTAQTNALGCVSDAQQKATAAAAHASATASAAAAAAAAAAGLSTTGAMPHRQPTNAGGKGTSGTASGGSAGAGGANSKTSSAAAAANSKLAASSEEAAAAAAAAAAAVAAMPEPAALAAIHAELQTALETEVALLQQRLHVLGHRATVLVDEVVQLHAAANSQMAEWVHKRYVEECGAVAALERVAKAAAAAGKPLAQDLRLEVCAGCMVGCDYMQRLWLTRLSEHTSMLGGACTASNIALMIVLP